MHPKKLTDSTVFWVNQDFSVVEKGKPRPRGKHILIGRLQMNPEPSASEEHGESFDQLHQPQLQTELVEMLKHMFLPSRKLIKDISPSS